jgi:hypothetical protein
MNDHRRESWQIMASHICHLAGVALLGDGPKHDVEYAIHVASGMRIEHEPEFAYRRALSWLGMSHEEIDASARSVRAGTHPLALSGKVNWLLGGANVQSFGETGSDNNAGLSAALLLLASKSSHMAQDESDSSDG